MSNYNCDNKELTPVAYQKSAIKTVSFLKESGEECFRLHWHERMEFLRVRSGEIEVVCGKKSMVVKKDELVIMPPKIPHRGIAVGNVGVSYEVLMFDVRSFYNDTKICQMYLPAIYDGRITFQTMTSDKKTLHCFDEIYARADEDSLEVTACVYRFLSQLLKNNVMQMASKINRDDTVMEIVAYIEENFAEELTSDKLAEIFGYTTAHFCRKFKNAVGLTPMNYLRIYRLEKAYRLLKEGQRNVSMVAAQCGFDDSNYFTRCFKAHFGNPPSKYIIK